ncbi:MAG: GNAT family N-acetyltransferase, partial [Rhodoglobus sp.]
MTSLPLSDRVTAPTTIQRPDSDDELTWRAATADDIDAIHEAARAVAAVDHPHYVETREDIAEEFDHSYVDPSTDFTVALAPDGTVLAWGFTILPPGQDTLVRSILFGGVRPDHRGRGIGRRLFAWQRERGLQQLASSSKTLPGWLVTYLSDGVTDAQHLYERSGLVVTRYFLELTRDVSLPIEPHPLDPEFRLENFSAARS